MVKRKIRKRKFGSTGDYDDDVDYLFDYGTDDTESEDDNQMDMGIEYQEDLDDIGLGGDVEDQIERIKASKNNELDISDAYLGDSSHEQNVDNLENLSENLRSLYVIFDKADKNNSFNLYQHSITEKIKFTEIVNTQVFNKLEFSRKKDVRKFNKKIEVIESLIQKLKNEKLFLKTGSFKKDIDDRIKRLKMEIKTAKKELYMTNQNLKIEKKEFESLKNKLNDLKIKNIDLKFSKNSYSTKLNNITTLDENASYKRKKTLVDLSDMSVQDVDENFILKPISEGVKLHNSVFSKSTS